MSIRRYFKPLNGLPHLRESLSASIPSMAIAIANSEVEKVTGESVKQKNKRGSYKKYVNLPINLCNSAFQ